MTTKLKSIVLRDHEVRQLGRAGRVHLRRPVWPQPRPGRYGPNHPTMPSGIIGPMPGQFGDGEYCVWDPPSGPQRGSAIPWTEACWYRIEPECPLGRVGEVRIVREAWGYGGSFVVNRDPNGIVIHQGPSIIYAADPGARKIEVVDSRWRPATQMPTWAARYRIRIEAVRVRRVREIATTEAFAAGIEVPESACSFAGECGSGRWPGVGAMPAPEASLAGGKPWRECSCVVEAFRRLWDSTEGKRPGCSFAEGWSWAADAVLCERGEG